MFTIRAFVVDRSCYVITKTFCTNIWNISFFFFFPILPLRNIVYLFIYSFFAKYSRIDHIRFDQHQLKHGRHTFGLQPYGGPVYNVSAGARGHTSGTPRAQAYGYNVRWNRVRARLGFHVVLRQSQRDDGKIINFNDVVSGRTRPRHRRSLVCSRYGSRWTMGPRTFARPNRFLGGRQGGFRRNNTVRARRTSLSSSRRTIDRVLRSARENSEHACVRLSLGIRSGWSYKNTPNAKPQRSDGGYDTLGARNGPGRIRIVFALLLPERSPSVRTRAASG